MNSVTESCDNLWVHLNSIYLYAGMNSTQHSRAQLILEFEAGMDIDIYV